MPSLLRGERCAGRGAATALVAGLLIAGCGSAGPGTASAPTVTASTPTAPPPRSTGSTGTVTAAHSGGSGATVVVSAASNGRTLRVTVGAHVRVRLDQLGWSFESVRGAAMRADGPPQRTVRVNGCSATQGCGSVQLSLTAVERGRGGVTALRGICGEDRVCQAGPQKFRVTFIVS